jgi:hypothetical protein
LRVASLQKFPEELGSTSHFRHDLFLCACAWPVKVIGAICHARAHNGLI